MKLYALTITCLLLFVAIGCKTSEDSQAGKAEGKLNGLHKWYYPEGQLYLEGTFKDSIPNGTFKQYFKNGNLFEEAFYVNGRQHGVTKRYHEDGKLSMEIPYDSGRIHGIQKKYRKDGTPAYEAPYFYDVPCIGLKEFFTSGRPVDNYPKLIIEEENKIWADNRYSLKIRLSKVCDNVQFFQGKLTNGKFIGKEVEPLYLERPGYARIDYFLMPGDFVMETVNVIAKVKTDLGNYYITQKSFNVAVENR